MLQEREALATVQRGGAMSGTIEQDGVMQAQEVERLLSAAARTGAVDFYGGKRAHLRFQAGNPFEADVDFEDGREIYPVSLHDVSATGVSYWSKHRVKDEAPVRLREFSGDDSGVWIAARVTHCTPGIRGFLVGAAFEHPANDDILERIAEANRPIPVEPAPIGWWRRLGRTLGLAG